jgi:hypothetical protein
MIIEEITQKIRRFRDERDWAQFHNPKDMAEAISTDASELLEQFLATEDSAAVTAGGPPFRTVVVGASVG